MAGAKYRDWNTGDKAARCKQMYADAKPHMTEPQCEKDSGSLSVYRWLDCLEAHDSNQPEIVRVFANSKCPIQGEIKFGGRSYGNPELVPAEDPGSLVSYTWNLGEIKPLLPPAAFLALVALLFMLTDIVRTFLLEPHIGWRRLAIVVSALAGVLVPAVAIDWAINDIYLYFVYAPTLAVGVCASILYGRKIFSWVHSGFSSEAQSQVNPRNQSQPTPAPVTTAKVNAAPLIESPAPSASHGMVSADIALNESGRSISFCPACQAETEHDGAYCSLCGRNPAAAALAIKAIAETKNELNLTWLWWVLGLTVVALSFIFRPGRALETLISTTVQVAILVPLIWLATRKKK